MVNNPIQSYDSITGILPHYDAFLIDLWGVIHDGRELYSGVLESLSLMREQDKKIIFLSNAPRRAFKAKEGLDRLGIPESSYDMILTSGETVFHWIQTLPFPEGTRYKMIGPARDDGLLDECKAYTKVDDINLAQFAIITGYDDDDSGEEEKTPQLKIALAHDIPIICANPDKVIVRIDGTRALCAGIIAQKYEDLGGQVFYYGKPYHQVYDHCLSFLAKHDIKDKSRIAVIGDNLETDIKGAVHTHLDSYLIASGILGKRFDVSHGELPDNDKLYSYCQEKDIVPYGVLPGLLI